MINKIRTALSIILCILMCVMCGTVIISKCQKAILMNEISQVINHQEYILDEIEEAVAILEKGDEK